MPKANDIRHLLRAARIAESTEIQEDIERMLRERESRTHVAEHIESGVWPTVTDDESRED